MRRLIVNADDFGLTAGVNRAVCEAHQRGVVTSTTVIVTGSAAGESEELRRRCPELDVGLHVNLTLGPPASDPGSVRSLVDAEGRLLPGRSLLRRALEGRVRSRELYREVAAQVALLRSFGVRPSHWDPHETMAYWAPLCAPAARAAADGGLRFARTPRVWVVEPGRSPALARMRWRARRGRRGVTELNRFLARRFLQRRFGLPDWRLSPNLVERTPDYAERWRLAVLNVPPGVSEIVCHPGYVDEALLSVTPRLAAARADDLRAVTDPALASALGEAGVALARFRDLAP